MSRTSKFLAKGTVKGTALSVIAGKRLVGFIGSFIEDVKDEVKKEEKAKDEPVQLDLPLDDPNTPKKSSMRDFADQA